MGGKKKTTTHKPRVKENSKPSSSDKATRFLVEQTGGLGVPLTCLLDTKLQSVMLNTDELKTESCQGKLTGFVPILQDPDASGLDTQLLNILRRLEKRDSVTKQKALREFYELLKPESNKSECISVSTSSIVAVLPFWPRIYHRLSFDGDRKVRELVQTTMHALASRVGKDLGLYLKQAYTHLLCLVNEFPLDYCNLKIHELEILEKLFIDSTLLGLHRSLGYTRVSDGDYSETGSYHSDDPDVSLVIATGTMEC
ncbi:unnamed protein product, partial [Schistosoma curassoni]|uniref:E3 ubiquitin-protein ligase listerin n=1 Tax=Schistosoma curassoni TaxID=6186 RepID=A0A183L1Y0_9TREM